MGLNMYIRDAKWLKCEEDFKQKKQKWDWEKYKACELAYWRKHPDLHGYIVKVFAGGKDECQAIPLTLAQIREILRASEDDQLSTAEGLFFGESQAEDKRDTRDQLLRLIERMEKDPQLQVYYQASW